MGGPSEHHCAGISQAWPDTSAKSFLQQAKTMVSLCVIAATIETSSIHWRWSRNEPC
jgi:hypothetical protein